MFTLIVAAGLGQCHAPAAAAVATYGHATTYAAPAHHAPAHHVANFVGFVAVDPYHATTVGAAARVEARAAADAKATADLTAQIAGLNATIASLAGGHAEAQAPAITTPPGAAAEYASVITASCLSCHNPAKQSGGLSFADEKGQLLNVDGETKLAMLESVAEGRMPKTKDKGSPKVKKALVDWIKADSDRLLAALKDTEK